MKLKTFNSANAVMARHREPGANINRVGIFCFNKEAVQLLALKEDSKVAIHQDEESPSDWYVQVNPKKDGLALRKQNGKSDGSLVFQSSKISSTILNNFHGEKTFQDPPPLNIHAFCKRTREGCGYGIMATP